jgi:hypothetical protein
LSTICEKIKGYSLVIPGKVKKKEKKEKGGQPKKGKLCPKLCLSPNSMK